MVSEDRTPELMPSQAFAQRQREARLSLGVSQAALARRLAELGYPLSRKAVNEIEHGKRRVTLDDALAIALALGVAPVNLLVPFEKPEILSVEAAESGIFEPSAVLAIGSVRVDPVSARAWIRGVETVGEATMEERFRFHVQQIPPPQRYRAERIAEGKKWWRLAEEEPTRFHTQKGDRTVPQLDIEARLRSKKGRTR